MLHQAPHKTSEHGLLVLPARRLPVDLHSLAYLPELVPDVHRLRQAALVQELLPAPLLAPALLLCSSDLLVGTHDVQDGEVIARAVPELAPRVRRGLTLVCGVEEELRGGGEHGDDVEHLERAAELARGGDGTREGRLKREGGHVPSEFGEGALVVECAEEVERLEGGADLGGMGSNWVTAVWVLRTGFLIGLVHEVQGF